MLDFHTHPDNWGLYPTLFSIGSFKVNSYSFCIILGLVVGFIIYYYLIKKEEQVSDNSFFILLAGLLGGILGAKIPMWIINFRVIVDSFPDLTPILSGRTVTGGLIGGTLSVIIVKRSLGESGKKGNFFAPGVALALAFGRVGCLLRGCCYGKETIFPWGIDLGDGVHRHPTQIYEIAFMLLMFVLLIYRWNNEKPGVRFYVFLVSYFIFRFFEEFLREGVLYGPFTYFQYISIVSLIFLALKRFLEIRSRYGKEKV